MFRRRTEVLTMVRRVTVLVMVVLALPQVALAETFLYHSETPFSMETDYRKTTVLSGLLFGHISQADEYALKRSGQQRLVQTLASNGIDLGGIKLLPARITGDAHIADTQTRSRERLFGGSKSDIFTKFSASGTLGLSFVSDHKLDLPGFRRQEVAAADLVIRAGARQLGVVSGVPHAQLGLIKPDQLLSASTGGGDLRLDQVVPRRQIYRLSDAVRATLKQQGESVKTLDGAGLDAQLVLNLKDGTRKTFTLSEAGAARPRVGQRISPRYLLHKGSELVRKAASAR